jgi:hypothetical protein
MVDQMWGKKYPIWHYISPASRWWNPLILNRFDHVEEIRKEEFVFLNSLTNLAA